MTRPATFYRAASYAPDESVGFMMRRIVGSIVHQVDKRLVAHDLTSAQWGPLLYLQRRGRCAAVELARALQMDAGALTRLLDRLEKKGLCRRTRSTEDRRVVQVELTAAGEAAIEQVPAVLSEVLNAHLMGFSKAEWQMLKTLLQRMLASGEALRDAEQAARDAP